jgi:hypothetical protein
LLKVRLPLGGNKVTELGLLLAVQEVLERRTPHLEATLVV